jgi:hypothetical protein
MIFDELTFAEHGMKNGDQLYAHTKPYSGESDYMLRMTNPGEHQIQMQQGQFDMQLGSQNWMFLSGQEAQGRTTLTAPTFPGSGYVAPFTMPQVPTKTMHYQGKGNDQNPTPSIWESFEMP